MLDSAIRSAAASLACTKAPAALPEALLAEPAPQLILIGPHGMGHAAALAGVGDSLVDRGHEVVHIDCRRAEAATRLAAEPPTRAVLLHYGETSSLDLLATIARRSADAHAPLIVGWDDSGFGSGANERVALLRQQDYALAESLERMHPVPMLLWPARSIDSLVHARHPTHPDALTLHSVGTLAAGRPKWAVELTQLAAEGLIFSHPRPAIGRLNPTRWNTPTMQEIRNSVGELTEAAAAAAIALCSLKQIAHLSATQVFGASIIESLTSQKLLVTVDDRRALLAPVSMMIEPLRLRVSAAAIVRAAGKLAAHLLSMAELGIALSEPELRFCAANLAFAVAPGVERTELSEISVETRSETLQRAAQLAGDFGRHDTARSLLVAASRLTGPVDPIALVRAIAGRNDPVPALSRLENAESRGADPLTISYLTTLLRAEAGIVESDTSSDHSFLVSIWSQQDQLESALPRAQEIAENPASDVRLRLLADSLLLLESSVSGFVADPRLSARARLRFEELAHPAAARTALARDAKATYLLTLAISEVLDNGSVRVADFREYVSRMAWSESHTAWLLLLEAATLALAVGDTRRAEVEWKLLLDSIPRFAAIRVAGTFRSLQPLVAVGGRCTPDPTLSLGHVGLILAHWSGDLETAAQLMSSLPDHLSTRSNLSRPSPMTCAVREAVGGYATENPSQLMRAAEMLALLGQWAPALTALGQARTILIRRRSSGAINACNARITELLESARAAAPWEFNPVAALHNGDTPRLTARESEVASLAANGAGNRAIATALSLSIRTVESHLAQARAKLGATSRTDLAECLRAAS